jgi:hypothetical protein
MQNIFELAIKTPQFKRLMVSDVLFTEYKCMEEHPIFKIWSHLNCFIFVISGKKGFITIHDRYEVHANEAVFLKKVGNIVHKFFDTDFCALMIFLPDDYIRCVVQQNKINSIFWNVVLTVALPLIMSVYTGIAEKAYETALQSVRRKNKDEALLKTSSGELFNHIELCRILQQDMVRLTNNFDFTPENELGNAMLVRKTLLASACKKTVEKAMELMGGQSYFRNRGIEKLFRDVQACHFHPLPDKQQYLFTGDFILNQKKHRKRLT